MNSFYATMSKAGRAVRQSNRRRRRGCLLRVAGCLGFLALLLALFLLLAFGLIRRAGALEPVPFREELAVQLVIDNSNSMFEKGGVGSDPELLRMAAARLFIEYLGVDDSRFHPTCGLIFFGSDAIALSPPVSLAAANRRATLVGLLADPPRMGWTDHLSALDTARRGLTGAGDRRAIILLTDGKPEWSDQPTPAEQAAYLEAMAALGRQLADEGVTLFIILLAGPQTDADAQIAAVWQPMWQDMAAATPDGRFLVARDAADLPAVYHDIVVALTQRQSDGVVIDGTLSPAGLRQVVPVEPGLARLMLVVRKSHPDTQVTIQLPDGSTLVESGHDARRSGGHLEDIWTIPQPQPGSWVVSANGEGRLTVWKDFETATPTPTPTATATAAPTETATATAIATATPMPAQTAAPTATFAPVSPAGPVTPDPDESRPLWPFLGLAALLATGVGGYLARRRRNRLPVLSGTLHVYDAAGPAQSGKAIDLYAIGKPAVTIGASAADIRLPSLASPLVLRVRPQPAGEPDIIINADSDVTVNGRHLLADQPLYDGDVIAAGPLCLRYENLQRRRPRIRPATHSSRRGITPSASK